MLPAKKVQTKKQAAPTITECFLLLPPAIDYAGFQFHLRFSEHEQYGMGLSYVLSGCHSHKKYKIKAWKQGYWEDRSRQRQISTMFSNYLFYIPLFDNSDKCLRQALEELQVKLREYDLIQEQGQIRSLGTGYPIAGSVRILEE